MSQVIRLYVDDQLVDLDYAQSVETPSYKSEINVKPASYQFGIEEGTGYPRSGGGVVITFRINAWNSNVIEDIEKMFGGFIWTPRRKFRIEKTISGVIYKRDLTAPEVGVPEVVNLRTIKIKIKFTSIDNFWISKTNSEFPIIAGETPLVVSTTVPVPFAYESLITFPSVINNYPFYFRAGEKNGQGIIISTGIPINYTARVCELKISNVDGAFLDDLDLSPFLLGALPFIDSDIIFNLESNTTITEAKLKYFGGVI